MSDRNAKRAQVQRPLSTHYNCTLILEGKELGPERFRPFYANQSSELKFPFFRGFEKGVAGTVSLPIFSVFFRFLPFFFRFFLVFFPFSSVFFRFLPFVPFHFQKKKTGRHRSQDPFCETPIFSMEKRPETQKKKGLLIAMAKVLPFLVIACKDEQAAGLEHSLAFTVWAALRSDLPAEMPGAMPLSKLGVH